MANSGIDPSYLVPLLTPFSHCATCLPARSPSNIAFRNGGESSSDESVYGFCSKRRRPVSALLHKQRDRFVMRMVLMVMAIMAITVLVT